MPTAAIAAEDEHGGTAAARVVHQVADGLTDYGLDILFPGTEQFKVTNVPGVICELLVYESGKVTWEYRPIWASRSEPSQITAVVLTLLGASEAGEGATPAGGFTGHTLKGAVGKAVRQCGMNARLDQVHPNQTLCEVYSEVGMTNPAQLDRGTVSVTDDNTVMWELRVHDPDRGVAGLTPKEIVTTIARSLPSEAVLPPLRPVSA